MRGPILYIGEHLQGTTSIHRRKLLDKFYHNESVVVDFNFFLPKSRVLRSIYWRLQSIVRLRSFENALKEMLRGTRYDIIWIDKGFFLKTSLIDALRCHSERLVFFTPDCFFHKNQVPAIRKQLHQFDIVVTTKSFEVKEFQKYVCPSKLELITQGYSKVDQLVFQEKRLYDVLFIGKHEAHREKVIKHLANAGIRIAVGGAGWHNKKQTLNGHYVTFLGDDFRGSQYQELISKSKVCLGLLSKDFPELHTTRTFEIPYFGSVLATERNNETLEYFEEHQALFYNTLEELTKHINIILQDGRWLEIARAGQQRVLNSSYSWEEQMVQVCKRIEKY